MEPRSQASVDGSLPLGVDDPLRGAPSRVVEATLDPQLPRLPLGEMSPDDFERLLHRASPRQSIGLG